MVSTVDVLSEQPWGETYYERRMGWSWSGYSRNNKCPVEIDAQFTLTRDYHSSYWFRGDIVAFDDGYWNTFSRRNNWKKWFMEKQDYLNSLHNDETLERVKMIPMYARLEYGMVVSRYKWAKDKGWKVFYDYGSIILMLTGRRAGHMRRYYIKCPFQKVARYPYNDITPYYKNLGYQIPEVGRLQEAMHYAKGDKDQFVLNMIESYQDENYTNKLEEKNDTPANFRVV